MSILDMKFFRFLGFKKRPNAPWGKYYNKKDMVLDIPDISIYEYLKRQYEQGDFKQNIAIEYYGTKITYENFYKQISRAARAFKSLGIRKGDVVTVLSANVPEALESIYALNKIGAVANIIHPLSAENEIKEALQRYSTVMLVALDITYSKIKNILDETEVYKTIIISARDSMSNLIKIGYDLTQGYKVEKPKKSENFTYWNDFIKLGDKYKEKIDEKTTKDTPAIILHSGGSTGTPKGIVLSNGNFNAESIQSSIALPDLNSDDVILAIMPIFHGFGLSVSITDALCCGAKVVLIPTFKAGEFDKLIKKHNPSVLVGVPTLFEAMTNNQGMAKVNLSNLKYVIAGGDTFSHQKVSKINDFLHEHGAKTNFTQGYGMTEAVAAVTFDLKYASKEGSIGIPWPGTYVKICKPNTDEEVPVGEDGEICICGPTVMLGYYNNEKETNDALHLHKDGNIWLHSGDIGFMDEDGFFHYKQRLKRMIVSSGYNVYPSQIEEVLERHEGVLDSTVIGIPHPYKVEVAKAFIVLKPGYNEKKVLPELKELCQKNLAHYSIPKEWEFRKKLPKTIVGKVDFRKLQLENMEKRAEEKYGTKEDKK